MLNSVTFQQIEAFLAIARYQSISRACEILYMSQPALSKILRRFEDNFGTPLFTRTNHGMVLTSAGKLLYAKLNPLYGDLDFILRSIQDQIGPEDRFLHIGLPIMFDFSPAFAPLKRAIQSFKVSYPQIKISETIFELHKLQNALDVGWVDLLIAPEWSISPDKKIAQKPICAIQQCILLGTSHPLAQTDELNYSDLNECDFLSIPYQDILFSKEKLALLCRENGIKPKSIECPPNFSTAIHSALNGNTATICWPMDAGTEMNGLKAYPLKSTQTQLQAVVAWTPDRLTRAAKLFLSMFHED